jgi:serine/threonine protein kinase
MDRHLHGSSFWLAPEIICDGLSDQAADIWSLGICIAEIINQVPFSGMFRKFVSAFWLTFR